ncbi:MAG: PleD family two-component system response regulator [Pseudomonadota bacterium]
MSGRVLIVDDTATNRALLKAKLTAAFYTVIMAETGQEALSIAAMEEPDLILLDVQLPDIDGFEVCKQLKAMPALAHVPVIMVTVEVSEEQKVRGLQVGADDFLLKPVNDVALLARVRNLLRMKVMFDELSMRGSTARDLGLTAHFDLDPAEEETPHAVLIAAEDGAASQTWSDYLLDHVDCDVRFCRTLREAVQMVDLETPDAVIIDIELGDLGDGRRLVSHLRAQPETRQAAILFIVDQARIDLAAQALDLGASDYLLRPFRPAELATRLRSQLKRKVLSDRLRANVRQGLMLALVDPLTGLFNRRYMERHLDMLMANSLSSNGKMAALMLDLDRFKDVNDRFGHEAGDDVLREFARRLRANVRGIDLVARLGGEEFLVAMPQVDDEMAVAIAERIRASVETPHFEVAGVSEGLDVTVSIGASLSLPGETEASALLRRADTALYASKNGGRNRVTLDAAA